jgi:alkylated DNA repair dioxygenase AlkB
VLSPGEEESLVEHFAELPFKPFEFHGFLGKRRVVSFGWRYEYGAQRVQPSTPMPAFLLPLRERAAEVAGIAYERLQQALVTEYAPGAAIGWHRDKPMFYTVIAFSFVSPCRLRLRRRHGEAWDRWTLDVQPRSAYLLRGAARQEWEHSIPPLETLRYSVTFRDFRNEVRPD